MHFAGGFRRRLVAPAEAESASAALDHVFRSRLVATDGSLLIISSVAAQLFST
jgi:hypothetical protein